MLNLTSLSEQILLPGTKGLALSAPLKQADIAQQNWNVLDGDTSFPVAVLKRSALRFNLVWMKQFCASHNILLAPHGKTTMSPQIFDMQLANGAWGMTLATVNQLHIAYRYGVKRVLLANQLISASDIRSALSLLKNDPEFIFYALVDSLENVQALSNAVQQAGLDRPLPLLVELGFSGGRTGCRSNADALTLARAIHASPHLELAGIEGYEGLLVTKKREEDLVKVRQFVSDLIELTKSVDAENLFGGESILLSAGGSAYFDLVAHGFKQVQSWSRPLISILRSGCYITHDHGFYHGLIDEMQEREATSVGSKLVPALEVWSMVQSRPEPDLAILTMGKRDASYDIDLPFPLYTHKIGQAHSPQTLPTDCKIEKMNDQHAYLRLPKDSPLCTSLQVGDLVACGISHPCTTFDKWPLLLIVNDNYQVASAINTFF
ncbi:amino acid deaminase [Solimicrobium silvestre]|uniref:Putative amino acid aldolase or racemase n=1 Tax=Solimicrobium silvestre TaxID=2099400 RepID=A0A2S9GXX7_9BURK|nr:amino acid deaminase [Solimicrobium silvestre]PRC92560.1 putative amino acid aldolase or racemase [Solimicrobium silvestre]